jgi:hypothetical protein
VILEVEGVATGTGADIQQRTVEPGFEPRAVVGVRVELAEVVVLDGVVGHVRSVALALWFGLLAAVPVSDRAAEGVRHSDLVTATVRICYCGLVPGGASEVTPWDRGLSVKRRQTS